MRRYFSARCLALHATLLVVLPLFAFLTKWQLERALSGNTLSWAYTFEWPLFAGYAVYVWWQLVHDQTAGMAPRWLSAGAPPAGGPGRDPTTGTGELELDGPAGVPLGSPSRPPQREPGWALTGGRERNVAIAAATAVGPGRGRERFAEQTPEEAEQLAAYNRYLAELAAADEAKARRR